MTALKHFFDDALVDRMARSIDDPRFDSKRFRRLAKRGLDELELLDRGRHLMRALAASLPQDYPTAIEILMASLGPILSLEQSNGMSPFYYLPHTMFVAEHGLAHFDVSMRAQHALTQRFSCEGSIRPFLEHHRAQTLSVLEVWASDESAHVRRLVSEGTRPRLPWAPRVSWLIGDPDPGLGLLERLRDDPSEYVRRSVANHLNDIAKDHPARVIDIARRWSRGASETRRKLVRHALRTLIKRGDSDAIAISSGSSKLPPLEVRGRISPRRAPIGGAVVIEVEIESTERANVVVDLVVHYVKADGERRPKVFKWRELTLDANEKVTLTRKLSLVQRTTRTHRSGEHHVELQIQGKRFDVGRFVVS